MFIWEILLIGSLAGMVILFVRRLPQALTAVRHEEKLLVSEPAPEITDNNVVSAALTADLQPSAEIPKEEALETAIPQKKSFAKSSSSKKQVERATPQTAEKAFKARDFKHSRELYADLLREDELNVKFRNRLGLIYLELEEFHEARNQFRLVLKQGGEAVASHQANLAMAEYGLGHHLTAIRHLKQAIALAPDVAHYQDLLETIEAERG